MYNAKGDGAYNFSILSFELVLTSPKIITLTLKPEYTNITGRISLSKEGVSTYYPTLTGDFDYDRFRRAELKFIIDNKKSSITF
ncbi:MAG: hypothetical protein FWC06_01960 [Treponema sp.]|nr:hypothetical protein [Treponema sp.]